MKIGITAIALALLMTLSGVSALGGEYSNAKVRVIHASPDAPAVDVWVNGAVAFENAPYTGVTDYAMLSKGTYNIQVVPTGSTAPIVIDENLRFRPATWYTVIALDKLESIEPLVLKDRNYWTPQNKAKVRFVHASPDAPAVDVAVKNGPILFSDIAFKEVGRYKLVPQGVYDLEVRLAGTETVVLELPGIDLTDRATYTAVAIGVVGEGTLSAVLAKDRSFSEWKNNDR